MGESGWCRGVVPLWMFTLAGFLQLTASYSVKHSALSDFRDSSVRNCTGVPPYLPPTTVNTTKRLADLRLLMPAHNISAYIIPATDAHLSEYIAVRDKRLTWITGFTGTAGTAVVTNTKAVFWTDSRYWIQAERQVDCNWDLIRDSYVSSIVDWLIREIPEGQQIGVDPFLFSIDTWNSYYHPLEQAKRTLISVPKNLVDEVWTERPPPPSEAIERLPDYVIERSWQDKVEEIRKQMMEDAYKPTAVLLSALDETAWLFNLRGNDIPYNPFFFSYTLLTLDVIWLFVEPSRVTAEIKEYLNASCFQSHCVQILEYSTVKSYIGRYVTGNVKVWIGTEYTTYGLYEVIPKEKLLTSAYSPVLITKSVKDQTEQKVLKEAHVRDAVAVIQLLVWLEKNVPKGTEDELSAAHFVDQKRSAQKHFRGPSFESISASGPNAALAHYSPNNETNRKLSVDEMYMIDSGGQYLDGTTDITRTVHWGVPSDFQREAFTRVLMGNIDLSRLIFPPGTSGRNVEVLARRALWEVGLNYGHGTGHGIGNYFSVHEWPVGFQSNNIALQAGMFTSIEPGYYQENDFGIRIEDVAVVVKADTKFGGKHYLTFETVSLVPYDRKLINTALMSREQIEWLDAYSQKIRSEVVPELVRQGLKEEHDWVMKHTEPFVSGSILATASSLTLTAVLLSSTLLQRLLF
ncbi:xaa-Pro aminopeptidase 2 [Acipenser oxyrinchus oxyrinchus]|uniref:Xaa-Pro aminopeptidase 2 n=1 Tax=Acipenser oxyrinchus oxyrinchus TaxID=40147 RepID=A0AAD8DC03_ACIOX|nr:xaa-Pro aminopeptidase 2 [Acipenser oxyrinchus oxyrinchus]